MRALNLDYSGRLERNHRGTVLLLLGAVLAGAALYQYAELQQELSAQQARTAEVRQAGKRAATSMPVTAASQEASAQEFKSAQLALRRLALRWEDLFGALESTRTPGVALLAIEPDPAKGMVKVTAEARTPQAMLDYVERLQGVDGLADVVLTGHQVRRGDPQKPMRFILLASWAK